MLKTILKGCILGLGLAASTQAAEPFSGAPLHLRPAQSGHATDWGGPYAGVHVGYGWGGSANVWWNAADPVTPDGDIGYRGITGGVHAGYQVQYGNLVLGAEADISLARWRGDDSHFAGLLNEIEIGGLSTLRGRIGWAQNDILLFATAGAAAASFRKTDAAGWPTTPQLALGWAVGAGAELALDKRLRARAELLHVRLDPVDSALQNGFGAYGHRAIDPTITIARMGVSYGF